MIFQESGDKRGRAWPIYHLGQVVFAQGDLPNARDLFKEGMTLFQELNDKSGIAFGLDGFAKMACAEKKMERAARLFGAAEIVPEAARSPRNFWPVDRADYDRHIAAVRASLGEEAFAAAQAHGRALTMEQAIAYALENAS
ncbi:MAG: hypothetical protein HY360_25415 [Verrucomicrobia bacterium]|nr:hypothetical protein [Verrucomicrobiota bacterium]